MLDQMMGTYLGSYTRKRSKFGSERTPCGRGPTDDGNELMHLFLVLILVQQQQQPMCQPRPRIFLRPQVPYLKALRVLLRKT